MAQIKVTPNQVRDTSRRIKNNNGQSNSYLDQIAKSIERLRGCGCNGWESDAAREFFMRFDKLKAAIERHKPVIDQYGNYLEKAASDYESSDTRVEQQAVSIGLN